MRRTLFEHLSPDTGPKRILALDGGGVKSLLTLGLLERLEAELKARARDREDFRLSDYYDLIGGASTGAILAAGLALGMSVAELKDAFLGLCPHVYSKTAGERFLMNARFDAQHLRHALAPLFANRTLGSEDLQTGLALFAKRIDTGQDWLVTNHPLAKDYDPAPDTMVYPAKRYRLFDLVCASIGSPTFFGETSVDIEYDERRRPTARGWFVDATVSGHNDPSFELLKLVLDAGQPFGWTSGPARLMMTSCGAGARRPSIDGEDYQTLAPAQRGAHALHAMAYNAQAQTVALMQSVSKPRKPWTGDDAHSAFKTLALCPEPLLDYQRIDVALDVKARMKSPRDPAPPITALERLLGRELDGAALEQLDHLANAAPENMALLLEVGQSAGRAFVSASYPDPSFDMPDWGERP